jgi:hypothetical protein
MELTGVKESHLPGTQAASARQTQARRVPNLEQFRAAFFCLGCPQTDDKPTNLDYEWAAIPMTRA